MLWPGHPVWITRAQLSRFTVTGGTFAIYYSALRRAGLIRESDGLIGLSDAGHAYAEVARRPGEQGRRLLGEWRSGIEAGVRTKLDQLMQAYPGN